jgi:Bacterial aa3 type cytochrome c oxidase subunit IV
MVGSTGMADSHEFKPGSMDIGDHEKTFSGFMRVVTWAGGLILVFLLLLAMFNG